jgi:hypothetical protein
MQDEISVTGDGNILIKDITGSSITINPANHEEIKRLIINLGNNLDQIPKNVLDMIEKSQVDNPSEKGKANIYLGVLVTIYETGFGGSLKFGITITNLNKEHRYFNQPFFKVEPGFPLEGGGSHDTFAMIADGNNIFPKRLEYGEPASVNYEIKPGAYSMYEKILALNPDAFVQVFSSTTVGEIFESNKYQISKLLAGRDSILKTK